MISAAIKIDDVDFMEALANGPSVDDAQGYETRFLQLERGPFQGVFETFRIDDSLFARAAGLVEDSLRLPRERAILNASQNHYATKIRVRGSSPPDRTCFWIVLPSSGPVRWRGADLPPGSLIELPPSSELDLVAEGMEFQSFSFRNEVRDTMFLSAGHRSVAGASEFPTGSIGRLSSLIQEYLRSLGSGGVDPGLELQIQDEFVSCLVGSSASVTPRVSSDRRRRVVRKVETYLRDCLQRPIPAAELAEFAQVPVRTLQDGFRRELGISPRAFHMRLRMQAARRSLRAASTQSTRVSDVALAFGFPHFGRFAVEYRRLFGESPFDTLRCAQQYRLSRRPDSIPVIGAFRALESSGRGGFSRTD